MQLGQQQQTQQLNGRRTCVQRAAHTSKALQSTPTCRTFALRGIIHIPLRVDHVHNTSSDWSCGLMDKASPSEMSGVGEDCGFESHHDRYEVRNTIYNDAFCPLLGLRTCTTPCANAAITNLVMWRSKVESVEWVGQVPPHEGADGGARTCCTEGQTGGPTRFIFFGRFRSFPLPIPLPGGAPPCRAPPPPHQGTPPLMRASGGSGASAPHGGVWGKVGVHPAKLRATVQACASSRWGRRWGPPHGGAAGGGAVACLPALRK